MHTQTLHVCHDAYIGVVLGVNVGTNTAPVDTDWSPQARGILHSFVDVRVVPDAKTRGNHRTKRPKKQQCTTQKLIGKCRFLFMKNATQCVYRYSDVLAMCVLGHGLEIVAGLWDHRVPVESLPHVPGRQRRTPGVWESIHVLADLGLLG